MAYQLEGVIKLRDETSAATKSAGKNVSGLEKAVSAAQKAFTALAVVAVAQTAKELFVLGAQADAVERRFVAFAGSGNEAEKTLRAIQQETGYTVDKMTAMTAATRFMSLGLADGADSAANLVSIAINLGDQTKSVKERVNSFGALLANQSIPRLDDYGISSGKVKERVYELQQAFPGMTREAAFNQAVMEQSAVTMGILDGTMVGAATNAATLSASWADLKTAAGSAVSDGLAPAVDGLAKIVTFGARVDDALASHADEAANLGKSYRDYATEQYNAIDASGRWFDIQQTARGEMERAGVSYDESTQLLKDHDATIKFLIESGRTFSTVMGESEYAARVEAESFGQARDAAAELEAAQILAAASAVALQVSTLDAAAALGEMSMASLAKRQLDQLAEAELAGTITGAEYAAAQRSILTEFGLLTPAEEAAQGAIQALTDQLIEGKIGPDEYAASVAALKNNLDRVQSKEITIGVRFDVDPYPQLPGTDPNAGPQQPVAMSVGVGAGVTRGGYGAASSVSTMSTSTQRIVNNNIQQSFNLSGVSGSAYVLDRVRRNIVGNR